MQQATSDPLVAQALPEALTWAERPQKSDLLLPAAPAVYLLEAQARLPVQLGTTQDLRRLAAARLLTPGAAHPGRPDLAEVVRGLRWRTVCSAFEGRWWYYRLARHMYPRQYLRLISFGPAWFLHVNWSSPVPEIRVTERIWLEPGEYVGPWLTHDSCQRSLEGLWDLFDLCRHPEQVRRAPRGQRCAYAEMGRCDAPCDGSVPLSTYVARVRDAWAFCRGAVRPWIDQAKTRMKQAAAAQRFEAAAQLKHQLAFAWKWHDHLLPVVHAEAELNFLLVVPVTRRRAWKLFLFQSGHLAEGPVLAARALPSRAVTWLAEQRAARPAPLDDSIRMEQTWLVAHFRCSREGDASLIRTLPAGTDAGDGMLEDELRQWVQQRRALRNGVDPGAPPSVDPGVETGRPGPAHRQKGQ